MLVFKMRNVDKTSIVLK
ncbi:TPA: 23S rRNA methyltransferase attenuation leader peptide [Streptococcus suis]